jgi:DnaJ-class molecular chaperone
VNIEFDKKCSTCSGGGLDYDSDDGNGPCRQCAGRGRELTEAGKGVLGFVLRWLKVGSRSVAGGTISELVVREKVDEDIDM